MRQSLIAPCCALVFAGCSVLVGSERASEDCENRVDDDLDGRIDCGDTDCRASCPDRDSVTEPELSAMCAGAWSTYLDDPGCFPWGPDDQLDCGLQAQVPGRLRCASVGSDCRDTSPPPGAVHLVGGVAAGGDGSAERPFATLEEAIAGSEEGAPILLEGTVGVDTTIDRPVLLRGRCPDEAVLAGTLAIAAGEVFLENFTLRGDGEQPALLVTPAARDAGPPRMTQMVVVGESRFEGSAEIFHSRLRGSMEATAGTLVVEDTTLDVPGESACLSVRGTARVGLQDAIFTGCPGGGVSVEGDGHVDMRHSFLHPMERFGLRAACTDGSPCLEVVGSAIFRSEGGAEPALVVESGTVTVRATRMGLGVGPLVSVTGGELDLDDADLGPVGRGGADLPGTALLVDGASVFLDRVLLVEFASLGIDLRSGSVRASNLQLSSSNPALTTGGVGAVRAAAGTTLSLFDFGTFRADPCVVTLEAGVAYGAAGGVIEDARNAFCVPAGAYETDDLNNRITLIGVTHVFRFTDE